MFSKNCSVQILCPDVVELCQGDVKWESGIIPESCVEGPGWQGTLDLRFSDGFFILNWTALVKQAKCVHGVICSLVIRLDYMKDKYFLVKAKTKRIGNDIPFDTKCDNSTKAIEIKKKGTSSILIRVVSVLGGLIIPAGILVNVLDFFCSQYHEVFLLLILVFSL